jgi:hypothetical protein
MLAEQEAPFNQQVGTFNGKPVSWGQAHDLAARLPAVPAGTLPTAFYNASGVGANPASDRGEAIMAAARRGDITPDEALRMYGGHPEGEGAQAAAARPRQTEPLVIGQAWQQETQERLRNMDWNDISLAARRGASSKKIAALTEAFNAKWNPPQVAAAAREGAGARQEELATLRNQAQLDLEDKRAEHRKAQEEANITQRETLQQANAKRKAQEKQSEKEYAANADVIGQFTVAPGAAHAALSQLTARFGGPVARAIMQSLPGTATNKQIQDLVNQKLAVQQGGGA